MSWGRPRGSGLLAAVLGALLVVPGPSMLAAPDTAGRPWIMVDDDGRAAPDDCASRTRTYTRIQDALDDARPGDRISVCPGRYRETLRIGPAQDDVYLATEVSFEAVLTPPSTDVRPAMDIRGVTSFEMRGLRIRPTGREGPATLGSITVAGTRVCSPAPIAVRVRDSTDVTIRGVRIAAAPACGYRTGIDIARSSVIVSTVEVTDFLGRGIVIGHGASASIDTSAVRFLHTGRAEALPGATLDTQATGVVIDGAAEAQVRTVSVFTREPDTEDELPTLLWAGIDVSDVAGSVAIRGDTVVTRTWRYGIRVLRSSDVSILNTLVRSGFGDGYFLDALTGARILGSDSESNPTGIRLGPDTSDVLVREFRGIESSIIDCVDTSVGEGTAGTANTWRRSTGAVAAPTSICAPPDD